VAHHVSMYLKPPGGKVWHIACLSEGLSLCGAFSRRGSWVALFISDERTDELPLCRQCEKLLAERASRHSARSLSTTDSSSSSASGLSR
jgi:hypothetical protein